MIEFKPKVIPLESMKIDDSDNNMKEIETGIYYNKRFCYILNWNYIIDRYVSLIAADLGDLYRLRGYKIKSDGTITEEFNCDVQSCLLVMFYGELPTTSRRKGILKKKIDTILKSLTNDETILFLLAGRRILPTSLQSSLKDLLSDINFISNFTDEIHTPLSVLDYYYNDYIMASEDGEEYDEDAEIKVSNYVLVPDGFYNYALDFAINIGSKLRDDLEENQKTIDKLTDERDQLLEKIEELEGKLSKTPDVENSKADSKETEKELYLWTDEDDKQLWNRYQECGEKAFEDFENIGVDECKNRYYFLKSMVDNGDGDLWIK